MRRVDWNKKNIHSLQEFSPSRLAWGVWIEMSEVLPTINKSGVTPRMRRVDWNKRRLSSFRLIACHASHEACGLKSISSVGFCVAWQSRLAWGVWIEIHPRRIGVSSISCHASHEACGLKFLKIWMIGFVLKSRLAWGVWIEMSIVIFFLTSLEVTPRMRRVDWNENHHGSGVEIECHASHEACGLKCVYVIVVRE